MSIQVSVRLLVALVAAVTLATPAPLFAQSSETPSEARREVSVPVGVQKEQKADPSPTRRIRVVLVSADEVGLPVNAPTTASMPTPAWSVVTSHGGGMIRPARPGVTSTGSRPGNSLFDELVTPASASGRFSAEPLAPTVDRSAEAPAPARTDGRPAVRMLTGGAGRIHVLPAPGSETDAPGRARTEGATTFDPQTPRATRAPAREVDTITTPLPAGETFQPIGAAADDVYRIGAGDVLDVFVWRNADLSRQLPVRPDGLISLPLVGEVQAAGLSAEQLQAALASRLADYVQQPTVTVTVTEIRSLVIYVLGNVNSPGTVVMERNLTALQAIAMAGGLNEFADRNDIVVLRTDAAGVQHRLGFRYDDVVEGKNLASNLLLRAGDVIYVP